MTHKTKGLVLKSVKYGETSLIVTVLTELFGVQAYMVNGVRSVKKTSAKAALYQPGALLHLEVYHAENKNIQRIKEANWAVLYQGVLSEVVKNCIALFMVELLYKVVRQPENDPSLFYFCEDVFSQLDAGTNAAVANIPLYFSLKLPSYFGFQITPPKDIDSDNILFLDLEEGAFTALQPAHLHFVDRVHSNELVEILRSDNVSDLQYIKLHRAERTILLKQMMLYYEIQLPGFGKMKTLDVLENIFAN